MDVRIEDDMVELSGCGGYLMLCGGRRKVFMEGASENGVLIEEISGFEAEDGAIVLHADGRDVHCPFPQGTAADLAPHAARLAATLEAWR